MDTDNPSPLTQSHTQPPGAAAQLAEPGPNPARRGAEPNVYIAHPTHGAGTQASRTQPPTAARETTLNVGQCVRQPREGRERNKQPPPPLEKENRGGRGGGGAREQPRATKLPANTTRGGQTPHPEGTEDRTPKEAQGDHPAKTGNTKPVTAAQREKGHRNMQTHTTLKKKRSGQPSPKENGWGDRTTRPGTGTASNRHHKAKPRHARKRSTKNTPRQPNQEERGTAETRAQQARPHTASQPGKAGNKRGARTNRHPRTATPTRRCRRPRGTAARAHTHPNTPPRRGGEQPKPKPQHARPHRTPEPETAGGRRSAHATTTVPNAGRNLSPTTNTTNSRQKRDNATNRTQTHQPRTPARTGGVN